MPRTFSVSDDIVISADPMSIYRHVSNPALMGQSSPENLGARVVGGQQDAYAGMTFDGHNKRGPFRWTTRCTVTAAEPGERFAFRVHAIGVKRPRIPGAVATWEYRFETVQGGTRVTEIWTDNRTAWPDFLANAFDKVATRGHTFAEFQRRNISTTLRNLKSVLERSQAAG